MYILVNVILPNLQWINRVWNTLTKFSLGKNLEHNDLSPTKLIFFWMICSFIHVDALCWFPWMSSLSLLQELSSNSFQMHCFSLPLQLQKLPSIANNFAPLWHRNSHCKKKLASIKEEFVTNPRWQRCTSQGCCAQLAKNIVDNYLTRNRLREVTHLILGTHLEGALLESEKY